MSFSTNLVAVFSTSALVPAVLDAQGTERVRDGGGSALWVFANICYAGMRAQNSPSSVWQIVAFIFGFPGTLLTYFLVDEGRERAYGIDLPRKSTVPPEVR